MKNNTFNKISGRRQAFIQVDMCQGLSDRDVADALSYIQKKK